MFKGTFIFSGWADDPNQLPVQLFGYDMGTEFLLSLSHRELCYGTQLSTDPTKMVRPVDRVIVSASRSKVTCYGALPATEDSNARPIYNWTPIIELVSNLWEARDLCTPATLDSSQGTIFGEKSNAMSTYTVGDYQIVLEGTALHSLQGPGWNLEHTSENVDIVPTGLQASKFLSLGTSSAPQTQVIPDNTTYRPVMEIIEANPERYAWLLERDYQIVTRDTLQDFLNLLNNHQGIIAFDTETTGLNINFLTPMGVEGTDDLVGMVFSIQEGQSFYVPLRHRNIENVCEPEQVYSFVEQNFKGVLETKDIIAFNATFDSKVMLPYNIRVHTVSDVQVFYHITYWHTQRGCPDPDNPKVVSNSLKALTYHYLDRRSLELTDFLYQTGARKPKWDEGNFADLPFESVRLYACADTDNTLALYNLFMSQNALMEYGAEKTYQIETALIPVLAYSEYYGIHFDVDRLPAFEEELSQRYDQHYAKCVELCGHDFNPNSTPQLQRVLYDELDYPILGYTEKGAPSAKSEYMKELAERVDEDGAPLYPFAVHLVELQDVKKYRTTFLKQVKTAALPGGYLTPSIQALLETGRMSTSKPNIQGMDSSVKKYFTARPGYYTLNFDFSSVEYRILASIAGEQELIEFFKNPVNDYHRKQAGVLYDMDYALVTPQLRTTAKRFNFALPYGKGDRNLGRDLFGSVSEEHTAEAARLRAKYFAGQKNVEKFFEDSKREASLQQWVATYFGRRRYLDPIILGHGDYKAGYSKMLRAAGNHKIQGTAADLYKMGMIRLYHALAQRGWLGKVLFTAMVHDECNIEVHESIAPWEILSILRPAVMIPIEGWCPLYVGIGFGDSWGQAKKQDLPVAVQEVISGMSSADFQWTGDVQAWYDFTEKLRSAYMVSYVFNYLNDPSNIGKTVNPDVDDYAHTMMSKVGSSDGATQGTYPNLQSFVKHYTVNPPELFSYFPYSEVTVPLEDLPNKFLGVTVGDNSHESETTQGISEAIQAAFEALQPDTGDLLTTVLTQGTYYAVDDENPEERYFLIHYTSVNVELLQKYVEYRSHDEGIPVLYIDNNGVYWESGYSLPEQSCRDLRNLISVQDARK